MTRDSFYGVTEQGIAGRHRFDDAKTLLATKRWRGAMYLAGYSVECLLKNKLMRKFDCRNLRELEEELLRRGILPSQSTIFTHQLAFLLRLADEQGRLRLDKQLWREFNTVNRWMPAWRYSANPANSDDAADSPGPQP